MNKKLNKKYIFVLLLLALFFICRTVLLVHSFSHKIISDEVGFIKVENHFLEKVFFFHDEDKNQTKQDYESCPLLYLLNSQKQLLFYPALFAAINVIYLSFVRRSFDKVKLSYLISSYLVRAPPQISL